MNPNDALRWQTKLDIILSRVDFQGQMSNRHKFLSTGLTRVKSNLAGCISDGDGFLIVSQLLPCSWTRIISLPWEIVLYENLTRHHDLVSRRQGPG